MPYGFIQSVPANEQIYRQVRAQLGDAAPDGLVAHIAVKGDGGLRYINVWDSEADWERFRDQHLHPAVEQVLGALGVTPDESQVTFEDLAVVDTWLGERVPAARR